LFGMVVVGIGFAIIDAAGHTETRIGLTINGDFLIGPLITIVVAKVDPIEGAQQLSQGRTIRQGRRTVAVLRHAVIGVVGVMGAGIFVITERVLVENVQ